MFAALYSFSLDNSGSGPTGNEDPIVEGWAGGTFALTVAGRNTYDTSSSLTVGTDFTGNWYRFVNGEWSFITSGSGSGSNVETEVSDGGYLWLMVEEISSKYYYVDVDKTEAQSSYIVDGATQWTDVDNDNEKEYAFKVDVSGIPAAASGYPARTYLIYLKAESGQGTAANALQWETQPSDISSVGTSTVTKYIDWETKLTAAQRSVGIYKIEIVVNDTDTTKWQIERFNVPGLGYLDGDLLDEDVRSSDTKYTYIIGTDFDDIVYWDIAANEQNSFDNTVEVKCTFGSSEAYSFTLYVYQYLYNRASISDSDAVVLST